MTTLPTFPAGKGPGFPSKHGTLDYKTRRMAHAMCVGIDTELQDAIVGTIPKNKPLNIHQAARAVGMKLRRARDLQTTPEFQSALREATEAVRIAQEPHSLLVAVSIRDDPANKPKDRLHAAAYIKGPAPERAGVTVNVSQNAISPGYVIRLNDPPEPATVTIEHEHAEVIPAMPSIQNTAGAAAKDIDKEHREQDRSRPEQYAPRASIRRTPLPQRPVNEKAGLARE